MDERHSKPTWHTIDILFLVAGLTFVAIGIWIGFEGAPFLNLLSKGPP
jgi:hypothetical protein